METLIWISNRYRPAEGWLAVALVTAAAACMAGALLASALVPEDQVVIPATFLGLFLGILLAQRRISARFAWLLLTAYGLLIPTLSLARLWPPAELLFGGWSLLRQYWLQNGALFAQRLGNWLTATLGGGSSGETVGYAFLLGLAAWFLVAYLGWSTFRSRNAIPALSLMGVVVGASVYLGNAALEWAAAFVAVAAVTAGVVYYADQEQRWETAGVGYSLEIRPELVLYLAGIGLGLIAIGLFVPRINPRAIAESLLSESLLDDAEDALARAFGTTGGDGIAPGQVGGVGVFPRAYLLGNSPELAETVVMTAAVTVLGGGGDVETASGRHWRGLSYEVYTGRGWSLSPEQSTEIGDGGDIPLPPVAATVTIGQTVSWQLDRRPTRYTLGLPEAFDQDVTALWRGEGDLVRVVSEGDPVYFAESRLSIATAEELDAVTMAGLPADLRARYTALPASVPARVHQLAGEVAGESATPYQQARALEAFLRQYPYSLEVPTPPADTDPVDFFLFELQRGYCDYYASAMVVMARSLGLPARLATGFLAQAPNSDGLQVMREINAHSWAEVYFPGYGWIEFEPTRPFTSRHAAERERTTTGPAPSYEIPEAVPLPEPDPQQRPFSWWPVIALGAATLAAVSLLLRLRPPTRRQPEAAVEAYYAQLQRRAEQLGQPAHAGQTVNEFTAALVLSLSSYPPGSRRERLANRVGEPITRLAALFVKRQYAGRWDVRAEAAQQMQARQAWQQIRRPLWWLALLHRLRVPLTGRDA